MGPWKLMELVPSENELAAARFQGRHVARIAGKLCGELVCRGRLCILSDKVVELLLNHGYKVRRTDDGVVKREIAGLPELP